ncbi:MAG: helix-turn-helix transcriptional regulator [Polyangiaceae bacterium]|nr:helix-turn-helix transcriptional regulator [Polyangiaceae bacterium]
MSHPQTIKLGKSEYVILTKAEYLRLQTMAGIPAGSVDAIDYARASIGGTLRAAREHAGLTQAELAKALKKSQPMVSGAESGTISVSERYVRTVLKACGLPEDWKGPKQAERARRKGNA